MVIVAFFRRALLFVRNLLSGSDALFFTNLPLARLNLALSILKVELGQIAENQDPLYPSESPSWRRRRALPFSFFLMARIF